VCTGVIGHKILTINIEHRQNQTFFFDFDGFALRDLRRFAQREKTARTRHKESPVDNDKSQMITSFLMKEHCSAMQNNFICENFIPKYRPLYDPVQLHTRRDLHVKKRTQ
jgi:hypothetical protein